MKVKYVFFAMLLALSPQSVRAADYDLKIPAGGFSATSYSVLIGQRVKLNATINNSAAVDTEADVVFKDGPAVIATKPISAKANGAPEEVWAYWTPESVGDHNIGLNVALDGGVLDANPGDNRAGFNVFVDGDNDHDGIGDSVDPDDDNDGVPDVNDDYPLDPTRSHDTDHDGQDNSVDSDDDNDGLYDWMEKSQGTNPLKYDTDGDGYSDKEDAYPLDPKRWKLEVALPKPTPQAATTITTSSTTPRVLGAEDATLDAPTATVSAASASSGLSDDQMQGRVLAMEDETATATPTVENKSEQKTEVANSLSDVNVQEGSKFDVWRYILWITAGFSAFVALLFFLLARKRKKEEEEETEKR